MSQPSLSLPEVERRAARRYPTGLETSCAPENPKRETLWPARVRDISSCGIGLFLRRSLDTGTFVLVLLPTVPNGPAEAVPAKVVRVAQGPCNSWFVGCELTRPLSDTELEACRARVGRPVILVVDDDSAIRTLLEVGLRPQGFEVWKAAAGQEAIDLYRQHHDAIAGVLLDVQMPALDGPHTLAALRQINPRVRAAFMSGDLGRYTEEGLLEQGATHVLAKPFRLSDVAQTLLEMVSTVDAIDAEEGAA
jgi:CheY-like chemotaxis protein